MVPVYSLVQPRPWTSISSPKRHPMDGRLQGAKRMLTGIASKLIPPFAPPATVCFPSNPCAPASIWKDGGNKVVTAQVL